MDFPLLKRSLRIMWTGLFLTALPRISAAEHPPIPPEFAPVSWLPVMLPAMVKAKIPANGFTLISERTSIQKEDTVTLLVQSDDGKNLRQWAATLIINSRKPEEKVYTSPAQTFYLNNGNKVEFTACQLDNMAIHVIGPYSKQDGSGEAKDVWSGTLINPQYLGLQLEATPAMFIRIKEQAEASGSLKGLDFSINAGPKPYPAEQIASSQARLKPFAITQAEERSFAGCSPALMNFFGIAVQTPGVREILREIVEISWLQLALHGGRVEVFFELLGPMEKLRAEDWGLPPETPVYSIGLRVHLYGKPVLLCRMALTTPRVPLLNCAGIIGISAVRPNGQGPRMMLRVMSAKPAPVAVNQ